jgi:hypothetical protein
MWNEWLSMPAFRLRSSSVRAPVLMLGTMPRLSTLMRKKRGLKSSVLVGHVIPALGFATHDVLE